MQYRFAVNFGTFSSVVLWSKARFTVYASDAMPPDPFKRMLFLKIANLKTLTSSLIFSLSLCPPFFLSLSLKLSRHNGIKVTSYLETDKYM